MQGKKPGKKRKGDSSPNSMNANKNKKHMKKKKKKNPKNQDGSLNLNRSRSSVSLNSQSSSSSRSASIVSQQEQVTSSGAKPVFVNSTYEVIINKLSSFGLNEKPKIKIMDRNQKVQIICATIKDKSTLIEKLKEQQFSYYTFSEPNQKSMIYVLKGLQQDSPENIKIQLEQENIPAIHTSRLNPNNNGFPIYLVHFERQKTSLHMLQQTHRTIGYLIVQWERFNTALKRLTQCRNCQQFGHAASNCGQKYRCVKCDMSKPHAPGQCARKSPNDEGNPKCVNCGGDHTANSSTCPKFLEYKEKVQQKRHHKLVTNVTRYPQPAPDQELINLNKQERQGTAAASWASLVTAANASQSVQIPSQSRSNSIKNVSDTLNGSAAKIFNNAQLRLNSIPGIHETFKQFSEFVSDLESAESELARRQIMINYLMPQNG